MSRPLTILKQYWGYDSFRTGQGDIINAVLSKQDVIAILPTGGGKSICYQVPSMLMEGLCLVISPLIALMKDQVANLVKRGIPATAIYSGQNSFEVMQSLQLALTGKCKFLYVSPERLESQQFKNYLPNLNINLIAVDEAHCVSQWGYDFRPPYLRIAEIRTLLKGVPMVCLTASATKAVEKDIVQKLDLTSCAVFRLPYHRNNLSYSVFRVDSKLNKLTDILKNVPGSTIVYCRSRKQTKLVASLLRGSNMSCDFYHAGLSHDERNGKQAAWVNDCTRVMVCTNAFGMGIDKPDVRLVVHYDMPDSIEGYYQEAGRAGRDGKQAFAVMLFNHNDVELVKKQPEICFPSLALVRQVYQHLCDYCKLDAGCGEGLSFDFDLLKFIKAFKLDVHVTNNAIKFLEQQGLLSVTDGFYIPSKVEFNTNRQALFEYEALHPELDELIKILLRTYSGIFDNEVSVYEKQVSRLLKRSVTDVIQALQKLHRHGVLRYKPQKLNPVVIFNHNRVAAAHLYLEHGVYNQRRELYKQRIAAILNYVNLSEGCRSKFLSGYFGDTLSSDCKCCDNCLKKKKNSSIVDDFDTIKRQIYSLAEAGDARVATLSAKLGSAGKNKLFEVLDFLLDEQEIKIDDKGFITVLKKVI